MRATREITHYAHFYLEGARARARGRKQKEGAEEGTVKRAAERPMRRRRQFRIGIIGGSGERR